MKINDQGFTERLSPQSNRAGSVSDPDKSSSAGRGASSSSSDTLQLSNLASRLQNTSSTDGSRAARLSQIASAVRNNTFQVNSAQISGSLVSEAIQGAAR